MQQLQRATRVGQDLVATAGYVGSAPNCTGHAISAPDPGPGAVDPRAAVCGATCRCHGDHVAREFGQLIFLIPQATIEKRFSSGFISSELDLGALVRQLGGDGGNNGPIPQNPKDRRADWAPVPTATLATASALPPPTGSVRTRPQVCEIRRCRGLLDRRMGNRRACGAPKRAAVHRAGVGLAFEHQRGKPGQSSYRSESLSFEPEHWPLV